MGRPNRVTADMIFVLETETGTLSVLRDEAEAMAQGEGVDVEADVFRFWDGAGEPLAAAFITPNRRRWFRVESGTYRLVPARGHELAKLADVLDEVVCLDKNPHFSSLAQIRDHLKGAESDD